MSYRAPAGPAEAELREKGSRFLALVLPAADEAAAKRELAEIARRYPDATHVCWAWRLGSEGRARTSDAGEPSGTAGAPMLRVLAGTGLSDALAVVVRWFGGTKLGKGGLARAYAGALKLALAEVVVAERHAVARLSFELPYDRHGAVRRLVHPPEVAVIEESFGETVRMVLEVREGRLRAVREALASLGIAVEPSRDAAPPS